MADFERIRQIQLQCLELILRPVVWFCVKRSQSFRDFTEVGKKLFIQMAERELAQQQRKVNISRLSVATGITRDEVKRFLNEAPAYSDHAPSVLGRVIGQWEQDARFRTNKGKPRILTYKGDENEFQDLVWSISKHHNPGTIMSELDRIGAVEKTARGVRLVRDLHDANIDPRDGYQYVANDFKTLMQVADRNLETTDQAVKHHHIRTEYDNLYKENLAEIQDWLYREGKAFHKRARDYLSQFDKDVVSPTLPKGAIEPEAGGRAILTGFSLTLDGEDPL